MDRRPTAWGLLAIASVLVLLGVLGHEWWTYSVRGTWTAVGTRDVAQAHDGISYQLHLDRISDSSTFAGAGATTYFGGVLAVILGAIAAASSLDRARRRGLLSAARVGVVLFAVTAVAAIVFLFAVPDDSASPAIGISGPFTVIGSICGVVALVSLDRQRSSADLGAPAASARST
jgi:hypothetical protein